MQQHEYGPGSSSDLVDSSIVSLDFNDQQDKIWFDVEIRPNATSLRSANYNQQFNMNIVGRPEDYFCAIPRFSVPTSLVPILSVEFQSGSSVNTIYSVTLEYNGLASQNFVVYVPDNNLSTSDDAYPYVYTVDSFLDMINTALAVSHGSIGPPAGSLPPYFQFDSNTGLISFVCQRAYYDRGLAIPINVYLNTDLSVLLEGFYGSMLSNATLGENFLMGVTNLRSNWYQPSDVAVATPPLYYIFTQNYPALQTWSPFKSMRLTSTTLPIKKEFIIQDGGILSGAGVLQDFIPLYNVNEIRPTLIQYTASQYHLINMTGKAPLNKLDFTFVWVDNNGREHNIYIPYGGVCSLQIAFFKKKTFTS